MVAVEIKHALEVTTTVVIQKSFKRSAETLATSGTRFVAKVCWYFRKLTEWTIVNIFQKRFVGNFRGIFRHWFVDKPRWHSWLINKGEVCKYSKLVCDQVHRSTRKVILLEFLEIDLWNMMSKLLSNRIYWNSWRLICRELGWKLLKIDRDRSRLLKAKILVRWNF